MPNTVLVGVQWGDEGKGKIIDVLTDGIDVVVRYQGGNNAGHTVKVGEEKYVLHLVPSGILHPGKICVIANGVVVDPVALLSELDDLARRGISPDGRFFLSDRAHVVFPYHGAIDAARESSNSGSRKIGTTKRGIGPSYGDKMARVGIRVIDFIGADFPAMLRARIEEANRILSAAGAPLVDGEAILASSMEAARRLKPFVADTVVMLHDCVRQGKSILFEGAQGAMLDIDFGTYPYVTSSNATAGGACTGSGVPPNRIGRVLGVMKAYTTRVGEGPFPTELTDDIGALLGREGNEFGATTGRPRRCGWFDAVVARYSALVNGVDQLAVTKLDVLDSVPVLRICTAYECDGRRYTSVPASAGVLARCRPVYEEMPGWSCSTKTVTRYEDLPVQARNYVRRICELTGAPLGILSVGPKRESTLIIAG